MVKHAIRTAWIEKKEVYFGEERIDSSLRATLSKSGEWPVRMNG